MPAISQKLKLGSLLGVTILLVCFLIAPKPALAGPGLPFGGQIILTLPCPCSANFLIIEWPIGKTSPIFLIYQPFVSVLFPFWNFFTPTTYIMGNYALPLPCVMPIPHCTPVFWAPLILMMGTSQY